MKTSKQQTWLWALFFFVFSLQAKITTIGGPISGTQVWTDTVIVNAHISAANAEGDSIRVMPGTVVLVSEGILFKMNNLILHSEGVNGDSIYFKPLVEGKAWQGFLSYTAKTRLILNHTVFEGAHKPQPTGGSNPKANSGGVISLTNSYGRCEIDRCRFSNNSAVGDGGAIYIRNNENDGEEYRVKFYIYNTVLDNNSAGGSAGALGLEHVRPVHGKVVDNCTFESNTAATKGGAVYLKGISLGSNYADIQNATFKSNKASSMGASGGAVYGVSCDNVAFKNCHFESNSAFIAGALLVDSSKSVFVTESKFNLNETSATTAGAQFNLIDSLLISRTHFSFNKHTGTSNGTASLKVYSCKGRLENSIFTDNQSGYADIQLQNMAEFDFTLIHNTLYSTDVTYPIVYNQASSNCLNSYINNNSDTAIFLTDNTSKPNLSSCHMQGGAAGPGAAEWTNGGTIFTTPAKPNDTYGFEFGKEPTDNGETPLGITMPTVDFYGNPRLVNGRFDIGAVECVKYPLSVTHGADNDTIAVAQFDSITIPLTVSDPYIKDWSTLTPSIEVTINDDVVKSENIAVTLNSDASSLRIAARDIVGKAKVILTVEDHDFPAILASQKDTFWVKATDIIPTSTIVHDTLKIEKGMSGETFATFTHGKDTTGVNLSFTIDTIIPEVTNALTKDMLTISGEKLKRTITISEVPEAGIWKVVTKLTDGATERNVVYDTLICVVDNGIGVLSNNNNISKTQYGLRVGSQFFDFNAGEDLVVELYNLKGQSLYRKDIQSLNGVVNVDSRVLAAGYYFLKIKSSTVSAVHRLFIR